MILICNCIYDKSTTLKNVYTYYLSLSLFFLLSKFIFNKRAKHIKHRTSKFFHSFLKYKYIYTNLFSNQIKGLTSSTTDLDTSSVTHHDAQQYSLHRLYATRKLSTHNSSKFNGHDPGMTMTHSQVIKHTATEKKLNIIVVYSLQQSISQFPF